MADKLPADIPMTTYVIQLGVVGKAGRGKSSLISLLVPSLAEKVRDYSWLSPSDIMVEDPDKGLSWLTHCSGVFDSAKVPVYITTKVGDAGSHQADPRGLILVINGNVSRSILYQIVADVILPPLVGTGVIDITLSPELACHASNPAVFPLKELFVTVSEHYPR